jgi:NAD-dependent SIR2 family protein deacetylase
LLVGLPKKIKRFPSVQNSPHLMTHEGGLSLKSDRAMFKSRLLRDDHLHITDCARKLASGEYRNVVVLTGAGVSTSTGLPDFGGKGVLALDWDRTESEIREALPATEPTDTHKMLSELAKRGWIRRVYTQNVDGLHEKSGLLPPVLFPMHGTVAENSCVRMGGRLPDRFWSLVETDFALSTKCADLNAVPLDLILVMGTSLQVAPACALPNMARKKTPRWWICISCFKHPYN